ncbi:MAG TPA: hypothetical protein VGQ18_10585 [Gemmatimonadales bacterium]|jgi:hypothetical protein|nr:hypothetical protein [Gemmatimonadales bacterium]
MIATTLLTVLAYTPAFAQDTQISNVERRASYGVELAFRSGHADRGFIINDRPVVQPVVWVTRSRVEFSVWGNLPLAETTDGARPQIGELELTRQYKWKSLTVAPAVTMYFYHDALNTENERSVSGWLHLSYQAGPFRLFTHQSLDVLTYRGAYYGEAGLASEGHASDHLELGGSIGAGWASARFNDAYAGVASAGFDRVSALAWLTVHVTPRYYVAPDFEFSTIVNPRVRAALTRPTFVFLRLSTGVEF